MANFSVYIRPQAWEEAKRLPGNMRQRVRREIDGLEAQPRPAHSKTLATSETPLEVRRLRLDDWRVVYAINDELKQVQVLTIRQRPPYTYADLESLLADLR